MPELPDVRLYVAALERLLTGSVLERILIRSPFVLRTVDPPLEQIDGRTIERFFHRGKRIVWQLDGGLHLVFHPMVAGRFHWKQGSDLLRGGVAGRLAPPRGKHDLLALATDRGSMRFTEASQKKRAGLWIVNSLAAVDALDSGGIDPLTCDLAAFRERLFSGNNTLKRALADPRRFCGIGNAYSDEILHRARLSPLRLTRQLADDEVESLRVAARDCLTEWIDRLIAETGDRFPEKVTAFRPGMAVHGKFNQPCPVCQTKVQRIRYADNECNYCPRCQTEGRLLADRSLSRLLKDDWPKSIEELE
jgi:formamidopyrimidine-DNA glycosylase